MAVRDLLWACPICRSPGSIRAGRPELCEHCGAGFRRGPGATIVAYSQGNETIRPAGEWLRLLGPLPYYKPDETGRILGPEGVRIKRTNGQTAFSWKGVMLGWVETYAPQRRGTVTLRSDGLHFQPAAGDPEHWTFDRITGVQPASSAIQVTLGDHMVSVKFTHASVRLWTQATADAIIEFHRARGLDVYEFNPHVRTRPLRT